MPHFIADGSLVSGNISLGKRKTFFQRKKEKFGKSKARIDEVLFSDDPRNSTYNTVNPQVEYNCTILGGADGGRKVFNVRATVPMGGGSPFNTGEIVLTPNLPGDPPKDGDKAKNAEQTTGSLVLLEWLHGQEDSAMITHCLKHPRSTIAAKAADGYRSSFQYGGVNFTIAQNGSLTATFGGGHSNKDGEAQNASKAGASISFTAAGGITFNDGNGQSISIDRDSKKIQIDSSQALSMSTGTNWDISVSGSATIDASGETNIRGGTVNIGNGGGSLAARFLDTVLGTDSRGGAIDAFIGDGSGTVLIGG